MRHKVMLVVAGALSALAILALVGYLVHDSWATERELSSIQLETERYERVLESARQEARQAVRERLRREEAALAARSDTPTLTSRRQAARRRRAAVRRAFGSRGFTASTSYMKSVEMPGEDPTETDQEIIDLAGEAASEEDLETAAEVLEAALKAQDPRARLAAVEMLSGLGEAGLVDISEFLNDPHPEVANLAADRWELGIQDLMDAKEQAALAKVGFLAITDEDKLRSLSGTMVLISDVEQAVGVLADVIREGANVQRTAAKEAYEAVTGEKWVDEKKAVEWLKEHCEPSDVPGGDDGEDETEDAETDENLISYTEKEEEEGE